MDRDGPISFETALLSGLARDGGLYLPTAWPRFADGELAAMASMPYAEVAAARIMAKFTGPDFSFDDLLALSRDAYASFQRQR